MATPGIGGSTHRPGREGLTSTGAAGSLNPQTGDTSYSPVSSRRAYSRKGARRLAWFNFGLSFSFGPADASALNITTPLTYSEYCSSCRVVRNWLLPAASALAHLPCSACAPPGPRPRQPSSSSLSLDPSCPDLCYTPLRTAERARNTRPLPETASDSSSSEEGEKVAGLAYRVLLPLNVRTASDDSRIPTLFSGRGVSKSSLKPQS